MTTTPTLAPDHRRPPRPAATRARRRPQARTLITTGTVAVVGYLVLVPLAYLLWGTFAGDQGFTAAGFRRAYLDDRHLPRLITDTALYVVGSTLVSVTAGTLMAYLYVRTDAPFKRLFFLSSIIPLALPSIAYVPAWIFLASPDIGLLNRMTEAVAGVAPFNVYGIWGMIFVQGVHATPLVFLLMAAAFRAMDASLEESAQTCGLGRLVILRRITLPLARPALVAATLIIAVQALESFEVPAMLGLHDGIYVFISKIYFLMQQYPIDYQATGALSLGLLVIATAGVVLSRRASRGAPQTITGKAYRPRRIRLGRMRGVVGALTLAYFTVCVFAPVLILIYASLLKTYRTPSLSTAGFTFDNYTAALTNATTLTAVRNSTLLGVGAAVVVMGLSAFASWLVVRSRSRFGAVVDALAFTPLVIPGLVLGLGLAFVYLRSPLPIYGTLWILLISYVTRFLPYGMRYANTAMHQVSAELEDSATVFGASWWTTMRRILLPLARPGLIAGGLYIVVVSFRELSSSILLYSPGTEVVGIRVFEQYQEGSLTAVATLGVLLCAFLGVLVTALFTLAGRLGVDLD
ncbi:ABC transporter permease [Thermomonospora umbrina]|uniref:Iron(III) transport system permease protein n=1 Tax=Thermomonospora umbrina TaxID=111806 RepID=A0A3D9SGQ2_9ACTN|nr:iron ABC transporter permease [Thermomonospora umbrina]REE95079.1 iron(III) transport system permease protein [Thermomonospora umbrina]